MSPCPTPWGVIGDFNAILHATKKKSRRPANATAMRDFQLMVVSTGLIDIGFKGNNFTWANNRKGASYVTARLDRLLVNQSWIDSFRDPVLDHLPRQASDHNPFLLSHRPSISSHLLSLRKCGLPAQLSKIWSKNVGIPQLVVMHNSFYTKNSNSLGTNSELGTERFLKTKRIQSQI